MRAMFPEYSPRSEREFEQMWQKATFCFDANVLLNLYRYQAKTRDQLFIVLNRLQDRLWLPHQAALEYHTNREAVIVEQRQAYNELVRAFNEKRSEAQKALEPYARHPTIDVNHLRSLLTDAFKPLETVLREAEASHPDYLESDPVRDQLYELFDEKVGDPNDPNSAEMLYVEAERRFTRQIPPGYEDSKKPGVRRFGDIVLWLQLLHYATYAKILILVTDDRKTDWWAGKRGKTTGPRPELIREMREASGAMFHLYRPEQFIEHANKFLGIETDRASIDEIREVGEKTAADEVEARQKVESSRGFTVPTSILQVPYQSAGPLGLAWSPALKPQGYLPEYTYSPLSPIPGTGTEGLYIGTPREPLGLSGLTSPFMVSAEGVLGRQDTGQNEGSTRKVRKKVEEQEREGS